MSRARTFGSYLGAVAFGLVALSILGPIDRLGATEGMHYEGSGRENPWTNCTKCHGAELRGNIIGPSCMRCHPAFTRPGLPAIGHHAEGREAPLDNCASCHGANLMGGAGPSCFTCHDGLWPGSELQPFAEPNGPYNGVVGRGVQLDGSGSLDLDGTIASYDWDFGDGNTGTGVDPTHTYTAEGIYTVTLTVTDDGGNTDTATTSVEVTASNNVSPAADAGGPYSDAPGAPLLLDGSGSSDPDGMIVSYDWDFGDGTTGSGAMAMHTYAAAGVFSVTLTVTDDAGFSDTATTTAQISGSANSAPTVDVGGPYSGAPGEAIQFDASGSNDPDGDSLTCIWTFEGDPQPVFGLTATHSWSDPGTYTATASVTDGVNLPVIVDVEVTIADGSPVPQGDSWLITVPFGTWYDEFIVTFVDAYGAPMVEIMYPDGQYATGFGFQWGDFFGWVDGSGNTYIGRIDPASGTMSGIGGSRWGTFIWFGEPVPW